MRMLQPPQYATLTFEAFLTAASHQRQVEKLHRDTPLEASIGAFCQPNASHPTLSETVMFAAEIAEGSITDLYMAKK